MKRKMYDPNKLKPRRTRHPNPRRRDPLAEAMDLMSERLLDATELILNNMMDRIFPLGPGDPPRRPQPRPQAHPHPRPRSQPQPQEPSLYEVLEISTKASPDTITAAWRSLSKRFHPDLKTGNAERMKLINQAYEVLSDPHKRKMYDRLSGIRS